eukprot:1196194-Prorocentrum_minimum.AAC.3
MKGSSKSLLKVKKIKSLEKKQRKPSATVDKTAELADDTFSPEGGIYNSVSACHAPGRRIMLCRAP